MSSFYSVEELESCIPKPSEKINAGWFTSGSYPTYPVEISGVETIYRTTLKLTPDMMANPTKFVMSILLYVDELPRQVMHNAKLFKVLKTVTDQDWDNDDALYTYICILQNCFEHNYIQYGDMELFLMFLGITYDGEYKFGESITLGELSQKNALTRYKDRSRDSMPDIDAFNKRIVSEQEDVDDYNRVLYFLETFANFHDADTAFVLRYVNSLQELVDNPEIVPSYCAEQFIEAADGHVVEGMCSRCYLEQYTDIQCDNHGTKRFKLSVD